MKRVIAAILLTLGAASYGQVGHQNAKHIVLPNPKLLGCKSSSCSQLWEERALADNAVYPRQVSVDIFGDEPCPRGLLAIYENSVSIDDLRSSIDEQYGKWALEGNATSPVKLWRVESERFAIQTGGHPRPTEKGDTRGEGRFRTPADY